MEPLIVIVGFLGAGKTTLLRKLVEDYLAHKWNPYIILNDYENANMDAQQFHELLDKSLVSALNGSCICCSGLPELRHRVNSIPTRDKGITLIEANGTTDACALLGFLGVGLNANFSPPVQISVVDARYWQKRGAHNELEANQVQASSLILLNFIDEVRPERQKEVRQDIARLNSSATVMGWSELDLNLVANLDPSLNSPSKMDHLHAHWSSCSIDLDDPMSSKHLFEVLDSLPNGILRAKACTRLDDEDVYTFVERVPSGETFKRSYHGKLVSGPTLLTIGPGSNPESLLKLVEDAKGKL